MSTTMFDAREALVRGSVYDRQMPAAPIDHPAAYDTYFHTHDRLSYIGAERTIPPAAAARIPVPVGMFIPPVPPPHHNFFGQVHSLFLDETLVTNPCILQLFFVFKRRRFSVLRVITFVLFAKSRRVHFVNEKHFLFFNMLVAIYD